MTQLVIPKTLESRETGDLVSFFNDYDGIVQKNSGIHDSKCLTINCLEPQCPIQEGTYTKIKLTDESVDVVDLDKSWISMKVQAKLKWSFNGSLSAAHVTRGKFEAVGHNLFVGLKSSSHIIDSYRILNANRKTGCEQTQALHENAIVHFLKPEEEIQGRPNIYTPWENAFHHDESVCGVYIPDFVSAEHKFWPDTNNYEQDIEFDVTIPLDDILPLSNISMYPNFLFGNLQLEFKTTSKKNFVWCFVSHKDAYYANDLVDFEQDHTDQMNYYDKMANKCFYQCSNETVMIPLFLKGNHIVDAETGDGTVFGVFSHPVNVKVNVENLTIVECYSNINGFKIKDSVKAQLFEKYSNKKLIIPSQFIDYQQVNNGPRNLTLQTTTSYTLTNVTNICVTFPRSINELTVSRNPHMSTFQLTVDNKAFPEQVDSTTSARYCEYVLANSYLDSLWCANKSLLFSLKNKQQEFDTYDGYLLSRDNSNYCFNASTERLCGGAGLYCDGLSKDISIIRLFGMIENGSAYGPTSWSSSPAPNIFFIQTTFWVCTSDGIEYVMNDEDFLKREIEENQK